MSFPLMFLGIIFCSIPSFTEQTKYGKPWFLTLKKIMLARIIQEWNKKIGVASNVHVTFAQGF